MNDSTSAVDLAFAHVLIQDDVAIIAMAGEIDMTTGEDLLAEAEAVFGQAPAGVVVDLEAVSFFGSSGIKLLLTVQELARREGVPLAIVAAHQAVERPLRLTGTDRIFSLFPNLPNALAAVRGTGVLPPQRRHP